MGLRLIVRWIVFASLALVLAAVTTYLVAIDRAYRRIEGVSTVIDSPYGDVEYAEGGSGLPVLVIHGSGGGYDQGELIARAVLDDRFRWIAPSRFGYLRSTFHAGATFDEQAHAYARLLDHLGVDKAAVVALSHGCPSALLFAALYPERVSSLTMFSCGVASSTDPAQAQANQKGDMLTTVFSYDPLYWIVSTVFRGQLIDLMGASNRDVSMLESKPHRLVDQLIDYMNPVAPRSAGTVFDNKAAMPNERIAAIRAPTLIFHARNDTLQLYRNAEFAAATIPAAQLHSFDRGGHLLLAVEQAVLGAATRRFILSHAAE